MNKKIFIPICIVFALILLAISGLWYMESNSIGLSVGRVLYTNNSVMLIRENSPIRMSNLSDNEKLFDKLTDGDKIFVVHTGIAESYPAQTGVYSIIKLADGTIIAGCVDFYHRWSGDCIQIKIDDVMYTVHPVNVTLIAED